MIRASLIYVGITIVLAGVDALRIKWAKGRNNIDHRFSSLLASIGMVVAYALTPHPGWHGWQTICRVTFWAIGFGAIRLVFYDIFLNIFRREHIDYESSTTSSYVDNHSTLITFWEKRLIGAVLWGVMLLINHLIFGGW